jgi:predicted PurR-regulated permease PerM
MVRFDIAPAECPGSSMVPSSKSLKALPAVPSGAVTTVFFIALIATFLYVAREVLIPIALAVLLSFVLSPVVRVFQRWYVPRVLAVVAVVAIAFAVIFALGSLLVAQVNQLATDLPSYRSTLSDKIKSVRGVAGGSGTLERASEVLQDLSKEIETPKPGVPGASPRLPGTTTKPIPVEVRQPEASALQTFAALITPLVNPLAMTGIVVIFVIFILLQREDLRNRMIRLAGAHDLQKTTLAIDEAGYRLSRLLLAQLALNAGFGVVIGIGLWLIGVPSAPLWGILAMALRFVPYIGAVIAAILPLIVAAAVGEGWSMVLWTGALFLTVEPLAGHVVEPMLYGHSSGLSPVAIVVSATFWTWLWGPIGLVLATPLTICLVVLGRHVDRLEFLEVLLGNEPALSPSQLVYQRLLAGDPVEAIDQAQESLKENSLTEYYDDILLEGIRLAGADARKGLLEEDRAVRIKETVAEVVEDLSAHADTRSETEAREAGVSGLAQLTKAETEQSPGTDVLAPEWGAERVLCLPGMGHLDEAVALIVAQVLRKRGFGVRAEQAGALSVSRIFALDTSGIAAICVCYIENASAAQIGYAVRRLRRKVPQAFILIALLAGRDLVEDKEQLRQESHADAIETSLEGVRNCMVEQAKRVSTRASAEQNGAAAPLPAAI